MGSRNRYEEKTIYLCTNEKTTDLRLNNDDAIKTCEMYKSLRINFI